MDKKYDEAVKALPSNVGDILLKIPAHIKGEVREISMRINKPLAMQTANGPSFVELSGAISKIPNANSFIVNKDDLSESIKALTQYSLHSYKDKINTGYITISGGHRAGLCGSSTYNQDKLISVNDISYINLRIAREIKGCAKKLTEELFLDGLHSTLIIGSPCSGKTTLLRDMAYWLSSGECGMLYKTALIDERGELAAVQSGIPQNQTGILTDVLDGYKKGDGMRLAIRSLSPQIIVIDEIGGIDDAIALKESINSGVAVIATIHANSMDELYKKEYTRDLIKTSFTRLVMLKNTAVTEVVSI